jgi:alpha-glucosidase (family GH31 glycosyl hydrolase)
VPIDTLSIDTDWKRQPNALSNVLAQAIIGKTAAYSWNGWEWNRKLFPHPRVFLAWAHRRGLQVALNIHPSIDSTDPKYAATIAKTGPLPTDPTCTLEQIDPVGTCHTFDLTQAKQLSAYFGLHAPIKADGVDEWWLDWCCDATTASAPGLTPDTWVNLQYAKQLAADGDRWLVLSRVGGSHGGAGTDGDSAAGPGDGIFAEHRDAIHFTGDTCATWGMVAFEAKLTADEGNVGIPYVSHDIGSFNGAPVRGQCTAGAGSSGATDPPGIYARWVQLGALQPILRLHSNHGKRLPWEYPQPARRAAADALRLREALVPYLYTVARQAYDTGMPIDRNLCLQWPRRRAAYRHPSEYTVGRDLLFSPVTKSGRRAPDTVWFPPGKWVDYFTGRTFTGPSVHTLHVPLDQMAMFLRAGSILPTEPSMTHTAKGSPKSLTLSVFGSGNGTFRLYDDAGTGLGYQHGAFTWTTIRHTTHGHVTTIRIGAASGHFAGEQRRRTWRIVLRTNAFPKSVTVDGHSVAYGMGPADPYPTVILTERTNSAAVIRVRT